MKFLKTLGGAGKPLVRLPKAGCNWCVDGSLPRPPDTICKKCHAYFKQVLASKPWNIKFRRARLSLNPFCQHCETEPATVVDHIQPWSIRPDLFWVEENTQCLCVQCHNVKTNSEDGGFGRQRKKYEDGTPPATTT